MPPTGPAGSSCLPGQDPAPRAARPRAAHRPPRATVEEASPTGTVLGDGGPTAAIEAAVSKRRCGGDGGSGITTVIFIGRGSGGIIGTRQARPQHGAAPAPRGAGRRAQTGGGVAGGRLGGAPYLGGGTLT